MKIKCKIIALIIAFGTQYLLGADYPVGLSGRGISLSIGTDFSIATLNLGYFHYFNVDMLDDSAVFLGNLSIPLLKPDIKDFRISSGFGISPLEIDSFQVPLSIMLVFGGNSNPAHDILGFGFEFQGSPGYYGDEISLAGEFVCEFQLFSNVQHSRYYRQSIYNDASDGWYFLPSGIFRLGGMVGKTIDDRNDIHIRGGYEIQGKYNLKIPPFYVLVGNSIRL